MDVFRINEPLSLLIGGFVIMLVFGSGYLVQGNLYDFLIVGAAAFLASIPHEIAHKTAAIRLGCYARYILSPTGLLITLITAIPYIPVKFIMPGYVVVSSPYYEPEINKRVNGVVSMVGPLVNIGIGVISLAIYYLVLPRLIMMYGITSWILSLALFLIVSIIINGWIAIFNLLPVPPLDGSKIISWKPLIWVIMIVTAGVILYIGKVYL